MASPVINQALVQNATGTGSQYLNGLRPWSLGAAAGQEYAGPSAAQLAYQQAFAPAGSWQGGTFVPGAPTASLGSGAAGGGTGVATSTPLTLQQALQQGETNPVAAGQALFGLGQQALSNLQNNSVDSLVSQQLQNMATGQTAPYDPTTQNAMFTQQAQMAAQAALEQQQALGRMGLQASDPAYQAQLGAIDAQRQAANQNALLGVQEVANPANYQAQQSALGQLGYFNQARNAAQTNQSNYLGSLYGKVFQQQPTGGLTSPWSMAFGSSQSSGGGGSGGGDFNPFGSAPFGSQPSSPSTGVSVGGGKSASGQSSSGQSSPYDPSLTYGYSTPQSSYPSTQTVQQTGTDLGQVGQSLLGGIGYGSGVMAPSQSQPSAPQGAYTPGGQMGYTMAPPEEDVAQARTPGGAALPSYQQYTQYANRNNKYNPYSPYGQSQGS